MGVWGGDSAVQPHCMGGVRGREKGHTHTHRNTHTQERTRECCTYPLATYSLKSARTLRCTFRVSGFRGSIAGRGDCKSCWERKSVGPRVVISGMHVAGRTGSPPTSCPGNILLSNLEDLQNRVTYVHGVCPLVLLKLVLCVSFLHGW